MRKTLLMLLGVLLSLPVLAYDFEYSYEGKTLTYTVISEKDKTVMTKSGTINGSPGNNVSGKLIIPEIAKDGDFEYYTVIEIGDYAFCGCSKLTSVEIPNSVTEIGGSAFSACSSLTSVKLSDALTSIGENAFKDCNSISVVEYPSTTPIEASGSIFATKVYDEAILYVPEGSKKTYEKTVPWNYFYNIEEKDFSETVAVSGLSFKQSSYAAEIGETIDLNNEVEILPADASDKTLIWKSSDESVATVSNGIVTVLDEGTCEITATTTDGSNLSAVCTINATSGVATIATDELCDVYSISGLLLLHEVQLSEVSSLAPGIYIIRQGNAVRKLSVK